MGSALVVTTGLVGLALGVATVIVETRVEEPMLALRLFNDAMFRNTNLVSLFSMAGFFGLIFLVPLYLQTLRGFTPAAGRSGHVYPGHRGRDLEPDLGSAVRHGGAEAADPWRAAVGCVVGRPATDAVRALRGFRASYLVVAGMTLVAALLALRIRDEDAAASMKARTTATKS